MGRSISRCELHCLFGARDVVTQPKRSALTDALISGIANGSTAYKLVGSYVSTPLNWAVIAAKDSKYKEITDLKGTNMGISRFGSGSHTMAYVMALKQGWSTDGLKFQVNNDIRGLIDSVNDGSTSAFMWEWFTTKPYADTGEVRFIGSVPTPWPSWLIAASPTRASPAFLQTFLQTLTRYVGEFGSADARAGSSVNFIKDNFGYPEEDIKAWLNTVAYPEKCDAIPTSVIRDTLSVLEQAGVVKSPEGGFDVKYFVDSEEKLS